MQWPWRWGKQVLPQHTDHAGVMWHGGENVELRSRIAGAEGLRLPFETQFITGAGQLAAEALVTLALVDRDRGKPLRRPPEPLARALETLTRGC